MKKSIHSKEYKIFLTMLQEVREKKGLRQFDVAQLLNTNQSFVSKYESGERRLDIIELMKIFQCMNEDISTFINELTQRIDGK